jgi:GTP-binding protein Era
VKSTLSEVDVIAFCLPADQKIGPGDRYIAGELAKINEKKHRTPIIAVVTKADLVDRERMTEHLLDVNQLGDFADIVPVSAQDGYQVDTLSDVLVSHLPEGGEFYLDGELTDEPESVMIAELIREAALEGVRDELPHSLAVVVDEINERDKKKRRYAHGGRTRVLVRGTRLSEGDRHRQGRLTSTACGESSPCGNRGITRCSRVS